MTSIPMTFEEHAAAYIYPNQRMEGQHDRNDKWNTKTTARSHHPYSTDENCRISTEEISQELRNASKDPSGIKIPEDGQKRFECSYCFKRFTRPSSMKTHMNSHTGERPHSCNRCEARFSVRSNMMRHFKRCSKNEPI